MLLAWPAADTDWRHDLAAAQRAYADLIAAITAFEPVVLLVQPGQAPGELDRRLPAASRWPVHRLHLPYDDTWVRDSGPLTTRDAHGALRWLDFRFDAWGGKFSSDQDDRLVGELSRVPLFRHLPVTRYGWVLEGGAIDVDGAGTVLTTRSCLARRMAGLTRGEIEARLGAALGVERFLWLEHGALAGDDTDGHVDTLARFADARTIVFQGCTDEDDRHHAPLRRMADELARFETAGGGPYRLLELPLPAARHDADGRRLPAGYANFLILNGAVLMPTCGDPADAPARRVLAEAFPDREVVGVDCASLIHQGGSLHCATMQLPEGCLNA